MTHDVLIDGKEYVLNTQAEHKEGDAIPFMISKKDMEHHMFVLDGAIESLEKNGLFETGMCYGLRRMRKAFQHMIDQAEERGNWK